MPGSTSKRPLWEDDQPYWVTANKPQPTHGINGPEVVALSAQQAKNFGTRVESKDVVAVDFRKRPFTTTTHDGERRSAHGHHRNGGAGGLPRPAE